MSAWADIKKSVNSDLGKEDFLALDEIAMMDKEYIYSDDILMKFTMNGERAVTFRSYAKGYIKVGMDFKEPGQKLSFYRNESLIGEIVPKVIGSDREAPFPLKLYRGGVVKIVLENTEVDLGECDIALRGTLVSHRGLREVD